jgi:hypothetical protein
MSQIYFPSSGVSIVDSPSVAMALAEKGFCFIPGSAYQIGESLIYQWSGFADAWNRLVDDRRLADGGRYRQRRLGSFHFNPQSETLIPQEVEGYYYQPREINPINGGTDRKFVPLEAEFAANPLLHSLILFYFNLLPSACRNMPLLVYVHPFRILAKSGRAGYPTSEGLHRDGHKFTVQVFVNRQNVEGGISRIWNQDATAILMQQQMTHPLDSFILNDEWVQHDVTPISPCSDEFRDIFTINFNLLDALPTTIMR